jgi:hypothetical protein
VCLIWRRQGAPGAEILLGARVLVCYFALVDG